MVWSAARSLTLKLRGLLARIFTLGAIHSRWVVADNDNHLTGSRWWR